MGYILIAATAFSILFTQAVQAETIRLGVLKFGTVNWELKTIKSNAFDKANGFELQVDGFASGSAAKIAFLAGELDGIVSDWIWVARQRAAGKDLVFIPYSKAVGSLLVPNDSPIISLKDLAGRKIGIAGGPLDKSWLILRAYAQKELGLDLKAKTEQVFGAPPLIYKTALQGHTDGTINFWHFLAKMKTKGFRQIFSVADAATSLGLDPDTPLLGYVVRGKLAREKPELVAGFAAASRAAKKLLGSSDEAWEPLRKKMRVKTDAEFNALIAGFRAGIPSGKPVDKKSADRFFDVMIKYGGHKLVGDATQLPEGVFYTN